MLERDEIYRGLLKKPSFMFLPLLEFVCFIALSGLLFMWVQSLYILIPIAFLYLTLLIASKWDQNFPLHSASLDRTITPLQDHHIAN